MVRGNNVLPSFGGTPHFFDQQTTVSLGAERRRARSFTARGSETMKTVTYGLSALGLTLLAATSLPAAPVQKDQPVRATGKVRASLADGRFEGQVCVGARPPATAKTFVLNAGLNVARVTDGSGKPVSFTGWFDPGVDGEARVYTLEDAPATMCVSYVGAFPVYAERDAPTDFKGLIAFNGDSVRASEQAVWFPAPFDPVLKTRVDVMAYDLEIACDGCRFLYMNGSGATNGPVAQFRSELARPLLLFGGTGPLTRTGGLTILNQSVTAAQQAALADHFSRIRGFYGSYLGQPLADDPTLLRMVTLNQVDRDRRESSWGFATWPTIALSGSVGAIGDALLAGGEKAEMYAAYLSHETAHYYFGTLTRPTGPYAWLLLESTAQFLSIKAQQAILGEDAASRQVAQLRKAIEKQPQAFVALDEITASSQIDGGYRYNYGPLLLLSLERAVGEAQMRMFMRRLLSAPPIHRWSDIAEIAVQSGIKRETWDRWRAECVAGGTRACVGTETAAL